MLCKRVIVGLHPPPTMKTVALSRYLLPLAMHWMTNTRIAMDVTHPMQIPSTIWMLKPVQLPTTTQLYRVQPHPSIMHHSAPRSSPVTPHLLLLNRLIHAAS
jgi:hypothetical protein